MGASAGHNPPALTRQVPDTTNTTKIMHADTRTVKRYNRLRDTLSENGYHCAKQFVKITPKVQEEQVELYTGPKGVVLVCIHYPIKNRKTDYTEAGWMEVFLPVTTENSTAAENDNLADFFSHGRPHMRPMELEEVIVMKTPAEAVAAAGDRRETAWARVLGGQQVECKAFDFEDREWLPCILDLNNSGQVTATTHPDGLEWNPKPEDLLDPKQFKF